MKYSFGCFGKKKLKFSFQCLGRGRKMWFTETQHFSLRPGMVKENLGRSCSPPKNTGKLKKKIPVLEFLGLNSTGESSYSPLTHPEQKYYTETTGLAAAVILLFIQLLINTLINERGVENFSWRRWSSVGNNSLSCWNSAPPATGCHSCPKYRGGITKTSF